jgi:hypothetical protein
MSGDEIADLLRALQDGAIDLEEVAARFRSRRWRHTRAAQAGSFLEMATAAQADPEPYVPGSFEQVVVAYRRGELTRSQYRILADAVADSIRAEVQDG